MVLLHFPPCRETLLYADFDTCKDMKLNRNHYKEIIEGQQLTQECPIFSPSLQHIHSNPLKTFPICNCITMQQQCTVTRTDSKQVQCLLCVYSILGVHHLVSTSCFSDHSVMNEKAMLACRERKTQKKQSTVCPEIWLTVCVNALNGLKHSYEYL